MTQEKTVFKNSSDGEIIRTVSLLYNTSIGSKVIMQEFPNGKMEINAYEVVDIIYDFFTLYGHEITREIFLHKITP